MSARLAKVLYYVDKLFGNDYVTPALKTEGHQFYRAGSWKDFDRQLENGSYNLAIALEQDNDDLTMPNLDSLRKYINRGGRVILRMFWNVTGYYTLFEAGHTGNHDMSPIHITELALLDGISNPVYLNKGYPKWSDGIVPIGNGVSLGTFPNGNSCLVRGNGARTVLLGFDAETLPAESGQRFFQNLIRYVLSARAKIAVSPFNHHFGPVAVNGPQPVQIFTVSNTGIADLTVGGVAVGGTNAAEFRVVNDNCTGQTMPQHGSRTCGVQFAPTSKGPKEAALNIHSNDPDTPVCNVSLGGIGLVTDISVAPAGQDFGRVIIGGPAPVQTFTIYNVGNAELTVGRLSIGGANVAEFSIVDDNCSERKLPPQGSGTCGVRFSPASEGLKTAVLAVPSNDPDTPVWNVPLQGLGVPDEPNISIQPAGHDFGLIEVNQESPVQDFTVSNTGTKDLVVESVAVTGQEAGMFKITYDQASGQTMTPGGSCRLGIKFAPTLEGKLQAVLTVSSNDPDTPTIELKLTGTVLFPPKIEVFPIGYNFGETDVGLGKVVTFTLSNMGEKDLVIGQLFIDGPAALEFSVLNDNCSGQKLPPQNSIMFDVIFKPEAEELREAVLHIPSNDPEAPDLQVSLAGTGVESQTPAILVDPAGADFGCLKIGRQAFENFRIANQGAGSLALGQLAMTGPDFAEFEITADTCSGQILPPGGALDQKVVFAPSAAGAKAAVLAVPSNDPANPVLQVPLAGVAIAPAKIDVRPESHNFSFVEVGGKGNASFNVRNQGAGDLRIGRAVLAAAGASEFRIAYDNCSEQIVRPGEIDRYITVEFWPGSTGSKTAALSIPSDDPAVPVWRVPLSGIGIRHDVGPPVISVTPPSCDFGSKEYGDWQGPRLFIVSSRTTALKVGNITITGEGGADFHLVDDRCSGKILKPSQSGFLTVNFIPTSTGPKNAFVSIPSNDPACPVCRVVLKGTGLWPRGVKRIYGNSLQADLPGGRYTFKKESFIDWNSPAGQCGQGEDWFPLNPGDAFWKTGTCPSGSESWVIECGEWELQEPPTPLGEILTQPVPPSGWEWPDELAEAREDPTIFCLIIQGTDEDFALDAGKKMLAICGKWKFPHLIIKNERAKPLTIAELENTVRMAAHDLKPKDYLIILYTGHSSGLWEFAEWDNLQYSSQQAFTLFTHSLPPRDILIINDSCSSGSFSDALHAWFDGNPANREILRGRRLTHFHGAAANEFGWMYSSGYKRGSAYSNKLYRGLANPYYTPPADREIAWAVFRKTLQEESLNVNLVSTDFLGRKKIQHPGFTFVTGEKRRLNKKEFTVEFDEDLGWLVRIVDLQQPRLATKVHFYIYAKCPDGSQKEGWETRDITNGVGNNPLGITTANEQIIPDSVTVDVYWWPE